MPTVRFTEESVDSAVSNNNSSSSESTPEKDGADSTLLTFTVAADIPNPSADHGMDMINESNFIEIIRRIPKDKRLDIEIRLLEVESHHLVSLHATLANQKNLFADSSFINDTMFPFVALQAVRLGELSSLQFGTLMSLWGSLEAILPSSTEQGSELAPEFIPLFTDDGLKNPRASTLLLDRLKSPMLLPNLIIKTPDELLQGIYEKAFHLPPSEQGFWMVKNRVDKPSPTQTITQRIKSLGVKFLAFGNGNTAREMIPSFGLYQLFLEVAFPHAVRLNPVIGDSTPMDIRKGSLERYRDIGLPFPGNELPKVADGFPAPLALDFIFHDRYHALRSSKVTPDETEKYVALGDKLNELQNRYNAIVQEFSNRHKEHLSLLPKFGEAIKNLPRDKKYKVTIQLLKKFNQEIAIIHKIKKMRKSNGQLKFRLWDMERFLSGGALDNSNDTEIQKLSRIIGNIELDISTIEQLDKTAALSKYSGRKVAYAALEVLQPEACHLKVVQQKLREGRAKLLCFRFFMPETPKGLQGFDDTIIDPKTSDLAFSDKL